jgi:hypothetical protein
MSPLRYGLEYGATIWNPYLKGDIDKLERIQNRAIRFVKKDYKSRETGAITKMREDLDGMFQEHFLNFFSGSPVLR